LFFFFATPTSEQQNCKKCPKEKNFDGFYHKFSPLIGLPKIGISEDLK
jgi:hypothetical protein